MIKMNKKNIKAITIHREVRMKNHSNLIDPTILTNMKIKKRN